MFPRVLVSKGSRYSPRYPPPPRKINMSKEKGPFKRNFIFQPSIFLWDMLAFRGANLIRFMILLLFWLYICLILFGGLENGWSMKHGRAHKNDGTMPGKDHRLENQSYI